LKYVNPDTGEDSTALVCKLFEIPRDNDLGSNVVVRAGWHDHKVTPSYPAATYYCVETKLSLPHCHPQPHPHSYPHSTTSSWIKHLNDI